MHIPWKRKPKPYEPERDRLLEVLKTTDPQTDEYETVMRRLNDIDKINNRSSEKFKTVVPALGTIGAVGGIYALQQFAGVIVPKALDALAARQDRKKSNELD